MGARGLMAVAACALATWGCVAEQGEIVEQDSQEISTGRCGTTRSSKTVRVKVMTVNLRHDVDQWERRFELVADEIERLDPDVIGL